MREGEGERGGDLREASRAGLVGSRKDGGRDCERGREGVCERRRGLRG